MELTKIMVSTTRGVPVIYCCIINHPQKVMAQKHHCSFAQFLWVGNGQGLPGVVLLPFLPGVAHAAALVWGLPGAGPPKVASLTCLVTLMRWLGLFCHISFILVFFIWWWKLSKRIRTEAVTSLESRLGSHMHFYHILLGKASHRASPDSRGGEINFTSWCELQRIGGHFTSIIKGNAGSK